MLNSSPPPRRVRHRARPMPLETDAVRRQKPVPAEPPPAFPSGSPTTVQRPGPAEAFEPEVIWRRVETLRPYDRNARTHRRKQISQIAASIEQFGFTNPVLVDAEGGIIAGHGRVEAARLLGLVRVPTIRLDHLSEAQKRAYIIADNRLAELAGWDEELLAIELGELAALDLDFDVEIAGFSTTEIDLLVEKSEAEPDAADELPELEQELPPVSQTGDLWQLGEHRLLCGDALDPECYARLMDGAQAQAVFTDPPYNVPVNGHVCGLGRTRHREFEMASGEMSEAEFSHFLTTVFRNLAGHSADGAIHFVCMDWRHIGEILAAGKAVYRELKNVCVWAKTNGGMGSLYRSQHELVFVYKAGTGPHINNVELGRHGRYRTNVWSYPGINGFGRSREADLAAHPTVKPVSMVKDAILDCSRRGGIVLDPFAGSGTTVMAAERAGRLARAMELDSRYVDVAVRRWQRLIGAAAIHAVSGRTFDEVAARRERTASQGDATPLPGPIATEARHDG